MFARILKGAPLGNHNHHGVSTGTPITLHYSRNTVSSKNFPTNMDFGQKVEPHGEYMNVDHNPLQAPNSTWKTGKVTFNNPLVLEHKDTTSNGWNMQTPKDTCVYIHTRLDGVVFYVGIGTKKRPYTIYKRNLHWKRTTDKHAYEVTILHENLTWEDACRIEIELIQQYRGISGVNLCNMTLGGEGAKGHKHSDEVRSRISESAKNQSPETRAKKSASHKGKTLSEETKAKISTVRQGTTRSEETKAKIREARKRQVFSDETRIKQSEAKKGNTYNLGKKHSEEACIKMSSAKKGNTNALGMQHSEETRAKISEAQKGKIRSEETRAKMSAAKKNQSPETRAKISAAHKARADKFNGKTGKALSKAVQAAGHDGIITHDKYGLSETVNLNGRKE